MKKLTTLILLLLSPLVVAQEKQIWACQDTDSTGLFWRNGAWESSDITSNQYLFTLDGRTSILKPSNFDFGINLNCNYESVDGYWFCSDHFLAHSFIFDAATGKAGHSSLLGAIQSGVMRDSTSVSTLQCTKF